MSPNDFSLPGVETRLFDDPATVAAAAAELILSSAKTAIAERGRFRICLAGGTTPSAAYKRLATAAADWAHWWVYHGDERCVPAQDAQRNSLEADQLWLNRVPVPREQVFAIPAEQGAEAGARDYEPVVEAALPFDLVLLGMGEDGHTASLFPGRVLPEQGLTLPVHQSPKPPPDRVSLTPLALTSTKRLLVLITGAGKTDAVRRWQQGEDLPVARVARQGSAEVFLDQAAAGRAAPG